MNNNKKIVSGIFGTEKDLAEAVNFLACKGIPESEINILNSAENSSNDLKINTSNKCAENAFKGLVAGLIPGAVLGSLFFVGILIIPVTGLAFAGSVIGTSAGIAIGGLTGAVIGGLTGMQIPKYEAVFFTGNYKQNILLIVKADNALKNEIKKKFTDTGAKNILIK